MPGPGGYKTVQARILAYARQIGWTYVSRAEAEKRRGFDHSKETPAEQAAASAYFDDLLDSQVRKFNPKYAEGPGALVGDLSRLHADIAGNRDFLASNTLDGLQMQPEMLSISFHGGSGEMERTISERPSRPARPKVSFFNPKFRFSPLASVFHQLVPFFIKGGWGMKNGKRVLISRPCGPSDNPVLHTSRSVFGGMPVPVYAAKAGRLRLDIAGGTFADR
ncbi:MAG: hypothetical protein ACJ8FY_04215 [Gemmataceae bacterium]